ncbi:MAG: rhodanese-like domain-containing protein [Candidatus Dadabacteria bacterium]
MSLFNLFSKSSDQLRVFLNEGAVIIDVRSPQEYNSGHIKGSKNIPLNTLAARVDEIKSLNKPVITVCHSGMRSGSAKSFLEEKGLKVVNGGSWINVNKIA